MMKIIYEDSDIIVIEKPFGCDSEKITYKDITNKEGDLFCIHRLDKQVGGCILYAKNKISAGLYSENFNNSTKCYLAIIEGSFIKKDDTLEDLLYHDQKTNKTFVVKTERKGVKKAILEYHVLDEKQFNDNYYSLLMVRIITGRTHQIRIQFGSRKHPIYADKKYGSKIKDSTIALWSYKYEVINPKTKQLLSFTSLPNKDEEIWKIFNYGGLYD